MRDARTRYEVESKSGLLRRLISALGPKALVCWLLVVAIAFSMTSGLTEAIPSLDAAYIFTVAATAVTFGWLLAMLSTKAWFAALLSLVFGVEFLLVRVGRLGGQLVEIVVAAGRVFWQIIIWYWSEQIPDWLQLPTLYLGLWRDIGVLLSRTWRWLSGLVMGAGTYDIVGSALVWGFGMWVFSVWMGWVVRRNNKPLLAVLPGSVLLSFVLSYTGANPYIFLPILGLTLVLMALMGQTARESRWLQRGVDFSQGLWSDVAMVATGLAIALVLASAVAPSISAQKIADWVRELTDKGNDARTEVVAEGLGLEQQPQPRPVRPLESARVTGMPQSHLIGSGPELSRRVVMVIETGELPPIPEEIGNEDIPRHYWRSLTYDRYFGRGWATSGTETSAYEPGEVINQDEAPHLRTLRQSVRLIGDATSSLIYVDGALVSVDQAFEAAWRPPGELFAATTAVRAYRADSVYPVATIEELQAVPATYPDWIMSRYLQLPDSVTERVRALARDLTATEATPYDRAVAIEQYLRQFPYNLDVPAPGSHADIADYFLFDLQEGYCDYFATSMVVLARAAGLPARLAIGYVNGTYDVMNARYVVTEADAHSWPEIYFPDYGWISFEPTSGRPPINRLNESGELIWPEGGPPGPLVPQPTEPTSQTSLFGTYVLFGLGGVFAVVLVGVGIEAGQLMLVRPQTMTKRLQKRLRRYARRLRLPLAAGVTPLELDEALAHRLSVIAERHGFTGIELLEPGMDEVHDVTEAYVRLWYRREASLSSGERWRAVAAWLRLRWRLWFAVLWRRSGLLSKANEEAAADEGQKSSPSSRPATPRRPIT